MARLHAMNLTTWKQDPYMAQTHPLAKLDQLLLQLSKFASSTEKLPPVTCTMAQLVVEA
jgi:hypothetical protein